MARVLSPNPETTPPDPRDVSEWVVSTSIGTPEIRMMTADESYVYVLDQSGNSRVRDSLDELAVSTVVDGNGLTKMYSTVAEAGGYPAIAGGAYPVAADGVIADAWRTWAGETRAWYELDLAGTKRMIIENYADDIAQGRWSPG